METNVLRGNFLRDGDLGLWIPNITSDSETGVGAWSDDELIRGIRDGVRKDGSFSFRFALPDGNYSLPARATSADGDDTRAAHLEFRRSTQYEGEVETHPQDPTLRPPRPEHTA